MKVNLLLEASKVMSPILSMSMECVSVSSLILQRSSQKEIRIDQVRQRNHDGITQELIRDDEDA
jgi:hypothetical protein